MMFSILPCLVLMNRTLARPVWACVKPAIALGILHTETNVPCHPTTR